MITDEMFKKGKFWTDGPMVVTGCTKVSPGCKNCWSEQAHVMRSKGPNAHVWPTDCLTDGRFNGKVHFNLKALERAVKGKKPKVICLWNDPYHEDITLSQMTEIHQVIANKFNAHHTFLLITKRIEAAADYCSGVSALSGGISLPGNIIHIATMENQEMVDKRMEHLTGIPGRRAVIIEPMLGRIDLKLRHYLKNTIHQVILGPENGKGKRPFKEEWAESVRAQCERAGIPFYRKDRGEGELIWR